jgi:hypothetical protein
MSNIVSNGSFESGDWPPSWTGSTTDGTSPDNNVRVGIGPDQQNVAQLGSQNDPTVLQQSLDTFSGVTYTLSYLLADPSRDAGMRYFAALIDGNRILESVIDTDIPSTSTAFITYQ